MTTPAAANLYLAQHLHSFEDRGWAVYNPHNKPTEKLPVIYGFNAGGRANWWSAQLLAEDGTPLGSHTCSHEGYMPSDLGVLEGSRPDRHDEFKKHYPEGYQMEFVTYEEKVGHLGLKIAIDNANNLRAI